MNKAKILVVENETIIALDIRQELLDLGYEPVACAAQGEEAILLTEQLRPDLVLMDIRLAGETDGVAAAQAIRERFALPVVFLTAFADEEILQRAKLVEPFGYLVKPFRERELRTVIEMALYKHQAETRLRHSEARYRAATQSALDAIITIDHAGKIVDWNRGAERIFGYTETEIDGQPLTVLIPTRYQDGHRAGLARVQAGGERHVMGRTVELVGQRKDGSEFPLELSLAQWESAEGRFVTGIIRDITERKWAEEMQLETNRQLETAIARANQMAVRAELASAAKSEFLANMSHEIRTPMNGVIGMTELLLDTELSATQRKYAETVRASGAALMELISDILDFSKIEAGRLDLDTLDFDLHALLGDFADLLALRAHNKGLDFTCAAEPETPAFLRGDPGRLRQVLANLAGNAVKFTERGEIAVRARLDSETDTEVVLRFSVRDTGLGIPAAQQELLFHKFTQLDASITRRYGGTGLGLAISKQLAELMGGEIGCQSQAGQGSEFWFTARLAKQIGRKPDVAPPDEFRGANILVVDDNATNRDLLKARLQAWGLRSAEAPDGPAALQALVRAKDAGAPIRAAFLDMRMPGLDGMGLARAIKADETLRDTQLVLMIPLGQPCGIREMGENGFTKCLTKPVRPSDLFNILAAVLAADTGQRARPLVERLSIGARPRDAIRILLAEDDLINQDVALGILKKLGLGADVVANGAEAIQALGTLPYDVVLMDVQMPELDGLEATRQIRHPQSSVRNHHIPIIAMTAHAMRGDREKCLAAGMNDYLSKPVAAQALAEMLAKWLPRGTATAAEPTPDERVDPAPDSTPKPRASVFDQVGMMAHLMDDEDLAGVVMDAFLGEIPKKIEALKRHLAAGDVAGVERQAHTIRGASGNVGGKALCAVAHEIEQRAEAGNLEAVMARMPELETQFTRLKEAMIECGHLRQHKK